MHPSDDIPAALALEASARDPAAVALHAEGRSYDRAALENVTGGAVRWLEELGVTSDDRVALCMEKSVEQVALLLACWRLGAIAVPVHPVYSDAQLREITRDCAPRVLIFGRLRWEASDRIGFDCRLASAAGFEPSLDEVVVESRAAAAEPAVLFYGTEPGGRMSGIAWSHHDLSRSAGALLARSGADAGDRLGGLLCLNVPFGLLQLVQSLVSGLPLYLHSSVFPKDLFRFLAEQRVTRLSLLPITVARMFQERLYVAPPEPLDSVRSIVVAGRLEPTLEARLRREFGTATIDFAYGRRVGFPLAFLDRSGGAWRPVEGVELIGPRESELRVSGAVASGIWSAELGRVEPCHDFGTGDRVRALDCGGTDLVPADDRIVTQGYAVYPKEIERALEGCPGVDRSAAFGVPHEEWGSAVVVAWIGDPGAARSISRRVAEELPGYMTPWRIVAWPSGDAEGPTTAELRRSARERFFADLDTSPGRSH